MQNFHKVPSLNPLTALPIFFPNDLPTHYAYIYAQCKKGFQLVMHIYMHTFHYFMFSWDYCKFYVIFRWNGFSRPLGVGEVVNGVRGPHPMKLGQTKMATKCHISRSILLTFVHLLQSSFTFWKTHVWGWWNVYIASWRLFQIVHIYMHKVVKGLSKKSFENFL